MISILGTINFVAGFSLLVFTLGASIEDNFSGDLSEILTLVIPGLLLLLIGIFTIRKNNIYLGLLGLCICFVEGIYILALTMYRM